MYTRIYLYMYTHMCAACMHATPRSYPEALLYEGRQPRYFIVATGTSVDLAIEVLPQLQAVLGVDHAGALGLGNLRLSPNCCLKGREPPSWASLPPP